jgi:origin recognition complex subunit 3
VTGPNIASQGLLFNQLSSHLKSEINGPVVTLRSGDTSNLKAALKQIIRDATNQRIDDEDEDDRIILGGNVCTIIILLCFANKTGTEIVKL